MGSWGAIILSFFGAIFAAATLALELHWSGPKLGFPFLVFAGILLLAFAVLRLPGKGVKPSTLGRKAIMWSSIGEGLGILVGINIVANLHHPEMLLPVIVLVVGLHFFPIAYAENSRPIYVLGVVFLLASAVGFGLRSPFGNAVSGFAAAGILWIASLLAVARDRRARQMSPVR